MKKKLLTNLYLIFPMLLLSSGCARHHTAILKTATAVTQESEKMDYNISLISSLAADFKQRDFSDRRIKHYSDTELHRLYEALSNITFFFPEYTGQVEMQERIFREELNRNIPSKSEIKDMFTTYLEARLFQQAVDLKKRFPDITFPSMPEKIIPDLPAGINAWRVYDVYDNGRTLEIKNSQLDKGPKVIMLMFPGCAAAERSMQRILDDPGLAQLFLKYGTVLTKRLNAETVALWRTHFGFPEVYLAYKVSDFPGLDFSASPHFYFLEDGKIKFDFTGWGNKSDPGHGKTEILKGFAAIGISTSISASR